MSSRKVLHPNAVGGPNGISFEEHIRRVEQYLAYEDPPTLLRDRIEMQACTHGISSLSEAERTFYALDLLLRAQVNEGFHKYFSDAGSDQRSATRSGLVLLGFHELAAAYERLARQSDGGTLDEECEEESLFTLAFCELGDAMDQYAIEQGLLPT